MVSSGSFASHELPDPEVHVSASRFLHRCRPGFSILILLGALHGTACADDPDCAEIAGIDPLLEPGTVVLLGEIHGTREAPAFAAGVACRALAAGRDVVLTLEIPTGEAPRLEAYLASAGGDEDRRALLAGPFWNRSNQDGRSSRAMADLLERARVLRDDSGRLDVRLFDREGEGGSQARDQRMAEALDEIVASAPDAVVIVLTGNVHARITPGTRWDPDFQPMGYLLQEALPDRRIVALDLEHAGGSAWVCTGPLPEDCGARPMSGSDAVDRGRAVRLHDGSGTPFDGVYTVGPLTASPPAVTAAP